MTDIGMNDLIPTQTSRQRGVKASEAVRRGLKRRYAAEARFKAYGMIAIGLALAAILTLFTTIISSGLPTFTETKIQLTVHLDEQVIDPSGERNPETLARANYRKLVLDTMTDLFPDVTGRTDKRDLRGMLSRGASYQLQQAVIADRF